MNKLPPHYVITPPRVTHLKNYETGLLKILDQGFSVIQCRFKPVDLKLLSSAFYGSLLEITLKWTMAYQAKVFLNAELKNEWLPRFPEISGLHLNRFQLKTLNLSDLTEFQNQLKKEGLNTFELAASCHDQEELKQAEMLKTEMLQINFVTLSPVLPTPSHPEKSGIGWDALQKLCQETTLPVYPLGGLCQADLEKVQACGGVGVAGIRTYWSNPFIL